jgi:GDP-4-dehydro-6-deoxy-D-mannose reductase
LKILITGVAGFVGRHLIQYLTREDNHQILGLDIKLDNFISSSDCNKVKSKIKTLEVDLANSKKVLSIIDEFKPQYVYHLAAQSSVSYSWDNPIDTFKINVFGGVNILESLKETQANCRVLMVCTAEEYGEMEDSSKAITEDSKIYPSNPYAISKSALDFLSTTYHKAYNLEVFVSRSFNHIGPGQSERFVASDFAKQIAEIENGIREPIVMVGNIGAARDFLDVRDVVKAYSFIVSKGKAGNVYNVCSGKKRKISDLLDILISLSTKSNIKVEVDRSKFRPVDVDSIYGSNAKLKRHTGWKADCRIEDSLKDTLDYWRGIIKKN